MKKLGRRGALVGVIVIVVIVVIATVAIKKSQAADPDAVFKGALITGFSTKQVEQEAVLGDSSGKVLFDITNPKDPKVSTTAKLDIYGTTINLQAYGTLSNQYVKISQLTGASSSLLNHWTALPNSSADNPFATFTDPREAVLGDYLVGNFSASDRNSLVSYALDHHVYRYDKAKVTKATVHGQAVLVYPITENEAALKTLNLKVAALLGIKSSDIDPTIFSNFTSTATLYITTGSKQIVKATSDRDNQQVSDTYSHYNQLSLPSEPKATLTTQQFLTLLGSDTALQNSAGASSQSTQTN